MSVKILHFAEAEKEPLSRKNPERAVRNRVGKGSSPLILPKPFLISFFPTSKNGHKKAWKSLKLLGFSQRHLFWCSLMEQGTGVEPASAAWEAAVLPMYEPCLFGSWVSYHLLIENATVFWRKRKTGPPMGGPVRYQQSFAPAGMASFSMRRFSFSSPFSL